MLAKEIKQIIEQGLPGSTAHVQGDGNHFEAVVVCADFVGKTMPVQHRMVYASMKEHIESEAVHAFSLKTYTPDAWEKQQVQD